MTASHDVVVLVVSPANRLDRRLPTVSHPLRRATALTTTSTTNNNNNNSNNNTMQRMCQNIRRILSPRIILPQPPNRQRSRPSSTSSAVVSFWMWVGGCIVILGMASHSGSNANYYENGIDATTTFKVWNVNAFSVAHHHHHHHHHHKHQYRCHSQNINRRNVPMGINHHSNRNNANVRLTTTSTTTIHMTMPKNSNQFESDGPTNNSHLNTDEPPVMIPNENTDGTTMATLSGSAVMASSISTSSTPTTITTSSRNSSTTGSSSNNSNNKNNPPFSVTLDDATQYSYTDAIQRTMVWVAAAIVFGSTVWITNGATSGEEFFAGYLVEQSLSVDNLFVFLLLFEYFQVPLQYQDRVLNWGIYGAMVMRAIMIGLGSVALQQFHFILLVFAAILVYSSVSFFVQPHNDHDTEDPSQNPVVKFSRSLFPSTDTFDEDRFFTIVDGIRTATPLFICMIAVEISDVVFAVDSIPAVFGVTENPLIVFSSNIFAIMGLRSLYTILSKAATDLKYLEPAVAVVLGFIGSKMIAEYLDYMIPTNIALLVVATVLSTGIGLSVLEQQSAAAAAAAPRDSDENE